VVLFVEADNPVSVLLSKLVESVEILALAITVHYVCLAMNETLDEDDGMTIGNRLALSSADNNKLFILICFVHFVVHEVGKRSCSYSSFNQVEGFYMIQ
jgi:hypothetical protein